MTSVLLILFSSFISSIFHVYCWKKLSDSSHKRIFNLNYFVTLIFSTIALCVSNCLFVQPFRLIVIFVLLTAINYFLVSKEIKQSLIMVVISQMILAFSEFTFAIIVSLVYKGDIQLFTKEVLISFILNIYILCSSVIIQKLGLTKWVYNLLISSRNTKDDKDSVIYSIFMIIIMAIATMETYMELPFTIVVTTNSIMAIVFIGIVITSKKLENKYDKISSKYQTSISSLKEYEVMIDKFRVDTHENKNEFLTIRNMLKDKNNKEDVIKYIDKIVDNKIKDNDKIMKKTAKIPSGGLRATIYSKLCLMEKLKIKYTLNISREVRTTDLIDLDEDLVLKICKILGVFLDNAIEAVKGLKKKEIAIDMYNIDNELCIDITNNFEGNLDLDKINNMKYTTKGEGHGYGLTLVNKLLEEESDKLENEKSINRDTFTQTLKIKM